MKISIYNFNTVVTTIVTLCFYLTTEAQTDSSLFKHTAIDTSGQSLNMDAVYNRPFLSVGKLPIAIGGYLEANTHYVSTEGVDDGFSFQMRRWTLFFSSTISDRIKFISELEFEDGTKEINIEIAAVDFEFHSLVKLRGGIILNPIGGFNQNHDGPRWDFVDRPISATTIIPSTLSNVGLGLHGRQVYQSWIFGYEVYLTNGFDDKVISNEENRTSLAAGNANPEKFEESNSGLPMFTGKLVFRNRNIGELGISYMTGVYNKYKEDGLVIDDKRSLDVIAVDFNTSLAKNRLNITGEIAKVYVDVPETYSQNYGTEQFGGFIDFVGTILEQPIMNWENAKLNLALRLEYADYNQDKFNETGKDIADHIWSVLPGIAFRPVGTTVLRFNYRYQEQTDLLGNPPAKSGAIQFGFSSYF